jgi:phosphomevalonate kinase
VEQGGSGSGGDVAASSLGGLSLVRVRHLWRTPEQVLGLPARSLLVDGPLEVQPVPVPADLRLLLAFSGVSADTRALVGEVRAFAQARPARWREHTERISRRAEQLAALLEDTARDGGLAPRESTLEVLRRAAAAMAALGDEAGVPIATPALQQICALASSAGGAAKPSGAGGGDCAVALAFGDPAVAAVEQRLSGAAVACFRVGVAKRFDPGPEPLALPAVGAS